jgi:hypothetical protein
MLDVRALDRAWELWITLGDARFFDPSIPRFFDGLEFAALSDEAKATLAGRLILDCTPGIGSARIYPDAFHFIRMFADEMGQWPRGRGLAGRRIEFIEFALRQIAGNVEHSRTLAAVFLLHQVEFMLRFASRPWIDLDGRVEVPLRSQVRAVIGKSRTRINSIEETYAIALAIGGTFASKVLNEIDRKLHPMTIGDGSVLNHLGDRIAHYRHSVSHGLFADPMSEGFFYSFLTAILVYGTKAFER